MAKPEAGSDDGPESRRVKMKGIDAKSLPDRVSERIVEAIAEGRFIPGERLVEANISAELEVSRIPVRAAFKALEKQGILVSLPHRGCRVMALTDKKVRQVFQVRADLELRACADTIEQLEKHPEKIKEADAILDSMERCARAGDTSGVVAADTAFHRWICATSENEIVMTLWDALAHHLRIIFGIIGSDWPNLRRVHDEHCALRDLLADGDYAALERAMRKHLLDGIEREVSRSSRRLKQIA